MIMFLHGSIAACFVVAGAFFFRFWRETLDRLFLLFALSFWLQALIRIGLSAFAQHDGTLFLYALRLTAYALIVAAILHKNFVAERHDPRK